LKKPVEVNSGTATAVLEYTRGFPQRGSFQFAQDEPISLCHFLESGALLGSS
jgi:hypothetical protein